VQRTKVCIIPPAWAGRENSAGDFPIPETLEFPVKKLILPIGIAAALLIAACGKKEEAAPSAQTTPAPAATQPAAPATTETAPAQTPSATTEQPAAAPAEQPKQ